MESTTNFPHYHWGALCCDTFSYFMCNLFLKVVLCMVLSVFCEGTSYIVLNSVNSRHSSANSLFMIRPLYCQCFSETLTLWMATDCYISNYNQWNLTQNMKLEIHYFLPLMAIFMWQNILWVLKDCKWVLKVISINAVQFTSLDFFKTFSSSPSW
jgi:hypothetical protein